MKREVYRTILLLILIAIGVGFLIWANSQYSNFR